MKRIIQSILMILRFAWHKTFGQGPRFPKYALVRVKNGNIREAYYVKRISLHASRNTFHG